MVPSKGQAPLNIFPPRTAWWLPVVLLTLGYAGLALMGRLLSLPSTEASPIWPAAGLALGALSVWGLRLWPGVLCGALLYAASPLDPASAGMAWDSAILTATGATLQALIGAWITRPLLVGPQTLATVGSIVRFLFYAGPVTCLISATWSVLGLSLLGHYTQDSIPAHWFTWWIGDCVGVLLVTPTMLTMSPSFGELRPRLAAQVGLPLLIAGILLVTSEILLDQAIESRARARLGERGTRLIEEANIGLTMATQALADIERFFIASESVSRREFSSFAERITKRPGVVVVGWLPRVPAKERVAFESAVQREGVQRFQIKERVPDGNIVAAGRRAEYFPVLFVEPFSPDRLELGLDLSSEPQRRKALEQSRDSGRAVATPQLTLLTSQPGFVIFVPVYAQGFDPQNASVEDRRASLSGYVYGALSTEQLFASLQVNAHREGLEVRVTDVTYGMERDLIAPQPLGSSVDTPTLTRELDLAGHRLRFKLYKTTGVWWEDGGFQTHFMLLSSLLATFLLALATLTAAMLQYATADEVEKRTDELSLELAARRATEEALRDSEAFSRGVLECSPDCLEVLSLDGKLLYMSPVGRSIREVDEFDAIAGADWLAFWGEADQAAVRHAIKDAHTGKQVRFQAMAPTLKGNAKWWDVMVTAIPGPEGEPNKLLSVSRDMTPQKTLEERLKQLNSELEQRVEVSSSALRERQELDRVLLDNLTEAVLACDSTGRLTLMNKTARYWHGINTGEPIEQPYSRYSLFEADGVTSIDQDSSPLQRALRGERVANVELCIVAPNATPRHVLVSGGPILDGAGRLTGAMIAIHDITSIKESQQHFKNLFEFASDAIVIVDRNGTIVQANRQTTALFGWPEKELIGRTVEVLLPASLREKHVRLRSEYSALPETRLMESAGHLQAVRKDGTALAVEISLAPLVSVDRPPLIVAAIRDISERLRQEEDRLARAVAEEANQAKSIFLAAMSHEIRTPMNAVLGLAEILSLGELSAQQADQVATIQESAEQLLRLIDDILDFSKIEAGKLEIEHRVLNLDELIEGVSRLLSTVAVQKAVALRLFISPRIPTRVFGDETRLRQVIYNLLGNAIKFSSGQTGQQGRVELRAELEKETPPMLRLTVTDNGIGMSAEVIGKLFTPFTQAESSTTRRYGGSGLGLAICKRIVDMMGGEILVASAPNRGATFALLLPLDPVDADTSVPQTPPLAGVDCVICDADTYAAADLEVYLKHAGASVQRLRDVPTTLLQSPEVRTVLITDADGSQAAAATPGLRKVLIGGTRQMPSMVDPNTILLASCAISYSQLVQAVSVAVGRATPIPLPAQKEPITVIPHDIASARDAGRLILVAEDDPINQKVILTQLGLLGYAAEVASNGSEALRLWKQRSYALLLTDLHMPEMDGYTLARAVRAAEAEPGFSPPRTPILALTANAMRGEAVQARAAGVDGYLTKPISLENLRTALDEWLSPQRDEQLRPGATMVANKAVDSKSPQLLDLSVPMQLLGDDENLVYIMLQDYLDSALPLGNDLLQAASDGDTARVSAVAHRLKSSSLSVGALSLGHFCAELESISKVGDGVGTAACLDRFMRMLEEMAEEIRRVLQRRSHAE